MYYGSDTSTIVKWEPVGKREIVVYYDDGIRCRYDSVNKTVYSIHPRTNDDEFINDDIYAKRFAWKLRSVVDSSGLSREEICERAEVSNAALSGYMNGKTMPTVLKVRKLARVLRCPVEDLLNVDDWDR